MNKILLVKKTLQNRITVNLEKKKKSLLHNSSGLMKEVQI